MDGGSYSSGPLGSNSLNIARLNKALRGLNDGVVDSLRAAALTSDGMYFQFNGSLDGEEEITVTNCIVDLNYALVQVWTNDGGVRLLPSTEWRVSAWDKITLDTAATGQWYQIVAAGLLYD